MTTFSANHLFVSVTYIEMLSDVFDRNSTYITDSHRRFGRFVDSSIRFPRFGVFASFPSMILVMMSSVILVIIEKLSTLGTFDHNVLTMNLNAMHQVFGIGSHDFSALCAFVIMNFPTFLAFDMVDECTSIMSTKSTLYASQRS